MKIKADLQKCCNVLPCNNKAEICTSLLKYASHALPRHEHTESVQSTYLIFSLNATVLARLSSSHEITIHPTGLALNHTIYSYGLIACFYFIGDRRLQCGSASF